MNTQNPKPLITTENTANAEENLIKLKKIYLFFSFPLRSLWFNKGFTLVELMVVVAIFTIMMGAIFAAFGSGRISYQTQDTQIEVQQDVRKAVSKMTKELRQAGSYTISTTLTANDTVIFQIPTGFDGNGSVIWSSNIMYFRGGLNNSQLLRRQNAADEVLANNVSTLAFDSPSSDIITVSITTNKTSLAQSSLQSFLTARIKLRN